MAKIVTALATAATFAVSFGFAAVVLNGTGGPKSPEQIQNWIDKEVATSQKKLPYDCGNGVTWFDIEGSYRSVNYKYQIDTSVDEIKEARGRIEQELGNSRMIKWLIPDEVQAYCTFYDQNGNYVFRMAVED